MVWDEKGRRPSIKCGHCEKEYKKVDHGKVDHGLWDHVFETVLVANQIDECRDSFANVAHEAHVSSEVLVIVTAVNKKA